MAKGLALVLFFILVISYPYGQQSYQEKDFLRIYHHAEKLFASPEASGRTDSLALNDYQAVISMLETRGEQELILFDSYLKSGILEMSWGSHHQALSHFLRAIAFQAQHSRLPDSTLFKPWLFAGSSYYELNDLDSARYCYQRAEDLNNRYPGMPESERLYNKAGALYYETGDYEKSIRYFRKALSLVESRQPVNAYFVVNYRNNIASALRKLGLFDDALGIYKGLMAYHLNQNELLHNIGSTYLSAGQYREAIRYLLQVKYSNQAKFNDIGYAYLKLKERDSAAYYLQLARSAYDKLPAHQKNLDFGFTLKYLGDLRMLQGDPDGALTYYQQAIIQTDPDFNNPSTETSPVSFQGLHNSFFLFNTLVAKGDAFHASAAGRDTRAALEHAFSAYSSALLLAGQVARSYQSDEARLFLQTNADAAYQSAIATGLELYEVTRDKAYLGRVFAFMEASKASVLQAGLHQLALESLEGLPQNLISGEKTLKTVIARLNIQLSTTGDSGSVAGIRQKILDKEIELAAVQDKLDQDPEYHRLKFDSRIVSMDTLRQHLLNPDEMLISYYFLKKRVICFHISSSDYGYLNIPLTDSLIQNMMNLRKELSAEDGPRNRGLAERAAYLSRALIRPLAEELRGKTRLIVIPHNELSYIPFEALPDPDGRELLLKKYAISYLYSANFLSGTDRSTEREYQVLALAPFASASYSGDLPVLPASRSEIIGLKGRVLTDGQATKQNFLESVGGYPVIHLATHARANDREPLRSYIEFYGRLNQADTLHRLYEQEIYQQNLQSARLVILSACETGGGQLIHGEGIMSMARAFSYAGCKSTIASLWKADDEATAMISRSLHAYLQKGLRKDDALRLAKLDYIESLQTAPDRKSPAYWAHLVLIGKTDPVVHKQYSWLILSAGLILLAGLGIFLLKKITGRQRVAR